MCVVVCVAAVEVWPVAVVCMVDRHVPVIDKGVYRHVESMGLHSFKARLVVVGGKSWLSVSYVSR